MNSGSIRRSTPRRSSCRSRACGPRRRMSTTFEVYPRTKALPTFGAIIDRSTMELHRFLESIGLRSRPRIHLRLQACKDHAHLPFSLDDPAKWDEERYAWFMVGD